MSPSEDASSSRRSWLDWWFAPRWRALLTWVVLTVLLSWIGDRGGWAAANNMVNYIFTQLSWALPNVPAMRGIALRSNVAMWMFWFEPFALRLNPLHGLAWLGLRIGPYILEEPIFYYKIHFFLHHYEVVVPLAIMGCSVLMVPLLRGSRSRPWMAVIGGTLIAGVQLYITITRPQIGAGLWALSMTLPYAAALVYGTRLLRPEESRTILG